MITSATGNTKVKMALCGFRQNDSCSYRTWWASSPKGLRRGATTRVAGVAMCDHGSLPTRFALRPGCTSGLEGGDVGLSELQIDLLQTGPLHGQVGQAGMAL